MRQGRLFPTVFAVLILLAPGAAGALTFTRVPGLDELSATAPLIVRGRVVAIEYDLIRVGETGMQPITAVHIEVLSGLKGAQAGQVITLRQLGGPLTSDRRRWFMVPGIPNYEVGEEVVAFVDDRTHPFFGTAYGDAGLLRIASDADGRRLVMNAQWRVLGAGPAGPRADGTACRPNPFDRSRCARGSADQPDVDSDDSSPSLAPLTVEALEARIRAHRGSPQAGPVQAVSGSSSVFAQAVMALLRHDAAAIRQLTGKGN
jgi:hypothetical protein